MKKSIFFVVLWAFWVLFLSGCSMVPDDEDIINWSVLENEIFWNNLDDEIVENTEPEEEIINVDAKNEDNNSVEEDTDESVEVEIQQTE